MEQKDKNHICYKEREVMEAIPVTRCKMVKLQFTQWHTVGAFHKKARLHAHRLCTMIYRIKLREVMCTSPPKSSTVSWTTSFSISIERQKPNTQILRPLSRPCPITVNFGAHTILAYTTKGLSRKQRFIITGGCWYFGAPSFVHYKQPIPSEVLAIIYMGVKQQ